MRLYGGEEIRVPEAGKVFVVGNVKKPGAYPVQDVSDTTVLKMLALAEGLMPFAAKQAFIYRREAGTVSKNEISDRTPEDHRAAGSPDVPLRSQRHPVHPRQQGPPNDDHGARTNRRVRDRHSFRPPDLAAVATVFWTIQTS